MRRTNLRSNQQAVADLSRLLKSGNLQLENQFQKILQSDSRPIEPLQIIMKAKPFPLIDPDKMRLLGMINKYIAGATKQSGMVGESSPVLQTYANVRGPYLTSTLQNLAAACVNTAKKKSPDTIYRREMNGIDKYVEAMQGAFLAEYDNIRALFQEDEWPRVLNLTCQGAISELGRTLRELNTVIRANLTTDCYLAYEVMEIMSKLSSSLDSRTGELKPSFAAALKPVRETAKSSLADLLDDTRRRINALPTIPPDGAAVPITSETMTRLMLMINFLGPISSIMISLGDGGWKNTSQVVTSSDQIPTLNSFQIGADGKQIFSHYCLDTIDTLLSSLEQKAKPLLKGKPTLGVFIANNATVIERMIRSSELQPLLSTRMADIDKWRKTGAQLYTLAWREPNGRPLALPPPSTQPLSSRVSAAKTKMPSKRSSVFSTPPLMSWSRSTRL
jgi:exocyst complex protein 7